MGIRKTLEEKRRETHENLYEAKELMDKVIHFASKETYIKRLEDIKDRIEFATTGDERLVKKDFKPFVKHLRELYKLLKHEFWNKRRIKKKIRVIEMDLDKMDTL